MEFRKDRLSIDEAKTIDLVNYLSALGYAPTKITGNDYWYLSPLREEKTASFKINRRINRWYDHGRGQGGSLIDFGIIYHRCTVGELLEQIRIDFSFQQPMIHRPEAATEPDRKIEITGDYRLTSTTLLRYLQERRIDLQIADKYCREVHYSLGGKGYYGIGFKNDSGGYEIRNPYFKSSSAPKGITTLRNGCEEAIVFEGFMDFLSFQTLHLNLPENSFDFVILNSIAFFQKARPFMEDHRNSRHYLDRDPAGRKCTEQALMLSPIYTDESELYKNHKDLNDWMVHFGKAG